MSKIEKMCELAVFHTTTELNLDRWSEVRGIDRDDPRFRAGYQKVLAARERFHASIIEAQVEVSEIRGISLTQAEKIVNKALQRAYDESYRRRGWERA